MAVFRWLAADALDAEVPECRVRTKVYARTDEGSGVTAAVFNWSLEPAENLTVRAAHGAGQSPAGSEPAGGEHGFGSRPGGWFCGLSDSGQRVGTCVSRYIA